MRTTAHVSGVRLVDNKDNGSGLPLLYSLPLYCTHGTFHLHDMDHIVEGICLRAVVAVDTMFVPASVVPTDRATLIVENGQPEGGRVSQLQPRRDLKALAMSAVRGL